MAVRDHASLVTHGNRNLVRTTVINSSQRRTCATMLTLTSHYMATNAKHPRYAPGLSARSATQRNRQRGYWLREKVCRELGVALGSRAVGVSGSRGWVPDAVNRESTASGGSPNAVKPGIHCVRTHWIRGFMAFHRGPAPGARAPRGAGGPRGARGPGARAGRERGARGRGAGGERGRDGGSAYEMMWEKGGVWGLGVISRRVRRWRGRNGRDATGACDKACDGSMR